jgi:hypothetical protein
VKIKEAIAGADDEFDDMLAKLCAVDVTAEAATSSERSASSISSSTSTPSLSATNRASAAAWEVSTKALTQACVNGNISQLRRWARHGIRVTSPVPLFMTVWHGKYEVVQCLVEELGADVNLSDGKNYMPLGVASDMGNLRMVQYLVKELGADANRRDTDSCTPCTSRLNRVDWKWYSAWSKSSMSTSIQRQKMAARPLWQQLKNCTIRSCDTSSSMVRIHRQRTMNLVARLRTHLSLKMLLKSRLRTSRPERTARTRAVPTLD